MEHLAEGHAHPDIKGRARKIAREMHKCVFLSYCHFLLDVYDQLAFLSLPLQNNTILPTAITKLKTAVASIELLSCAQVSHTHFKKF